MTANEFRKLMKREMKMLASQNDIEEGYALHIAEQHVSQWRSKDNDGRRAMEDAARRNLKRLTEEMDADDERPRRTT